jgi:hypothetical protein
LANRTINDYHGALTGLLIEKGYLRSSLWSGRPPTYYIEVNTTAASLDTQFYCSQHQYELMEIIPMDGTNLLDKIYLIARYLGNGAEACTSIRPLQSPGWRGGCSSKRINTLLLL